MTTLSTQTPAISEKDITIAEKIRHGRLAALASLRARASLGGNVVSIFENTLPTRATEPVFHSRRSGTRARAPRLLLTNRFAA